MISANQVGKALLWSLNFLAFLLSVSGFYGLCQSLREDLDMFKSAGDVAFGIVLLGMNVGIICGTGRNLLFKSRKIDGLWLLFSWIGLIFIYLMLFMIEVGKMGFGSSQ